MLEGLDWAKLVPNVLTDEQKQTRKGVSKDLSGCIKEYLKFLDIVITGDENRSSR